MSITPQLPTSTRIARLSAELSRHGALAGIAFPGADLQYLLGAPLYSHERLTALVLPAQDPGRRPALVLPELEATAGVRERCAAAETEIVSWRDGEDPVELVAALLGAGAAAGVAGPRQGSVLVGDDAPARHIVPLQEALGCRVGLLAPALDRLRAVKSAAEVEALAAAGAAIDRVHARMGEFLQVGRTEREVGAAIEAAIREEGMTHAEFVIVGSGPNGADPHHEVSDRVVEAGDIVVVDIGGPLPSGYHSDSTRTYAMGEPDPAVAADYAVLQDAQAAARRAVRPGMTAGAVDAAAREVLVAAGLGELFVHRTGHGIGQSVHEAPFISADSETVLEEGMCFSIEPGIYRSGDWGARLEDIVTVTADGVRELNAAPRGLRVL